MSTATIEVQSASGPKPGKKQGVIKTTSGEMFGIWPDKLGLLRPGRRYNVEFKVREHEGRPYKTITKVNPVQVEASDAPLQPALPAASSQQEADAVIQLVAAGIQSQQIEFNPQAIGRALRMAHAVYREHQRQSVAP